MKLHKPAPITDKARERLLSDAVDLAERLAAWGSGSRRAEIGRLVAEAGTIAHRGRALTKKESTKAARRIVGKPENARSAE